MLQALETKLARHAVYQDGLAVVVPGIVCVGRSNIAIADTANFKLWHVPHVVRGEVAPCRLTPACNRPPCTKAAVSSRQYSPAATLYPICNT